MKPSLGQAMLGGRIAGLDSIRGIAAFVVVLNHFYNMVPVFKGDDSWAVNYTPLHWLIAGRCSVVLFFVLSGFVLALPYAAGKHQPYRGYVIKRVCRIYVPFVLAVLVAAVLCAAFGTVRPLWAADDIDWRAALSVPMVISHVLMQGVGVDSISLNPPMWSLIFEMRISLLFPLLVLGVQRFGVGMVGVCAVLGLVAAKVFVAIDAADNFYVANSALGAVFLTAYYVPFFVLGAWMAHHRARVNGWMRALPRVVHGLLIAVFLFVPYAFLKQHFTLSEVFYAALAVYVIAGCQVSGVFAKMLAGKCVSWLGKVSYSLYLSHLPVLLAFVYGLQEEVSQPVILAVAMGVILVVAELCWRFVERPSQALGARLSA